ncbi:hypothetical protein [Tardiphaga sp.]|uniref:hypothetical protein n=1 Tax=Tardiphaga sp. TaxID=1926292 RepID=UPI002633EC59|nr:hypothetical protein [Tardiphaga sp.]
MKLFKAFGVGVVAVDLRALALAQNHLSACDAASRRRRMDVSARADCARVHTKRGTRMGGAMPDNALMAITARPGKKR